MARSTVETPWDSRFPPLCARCATPATKTRRIKRQKPSASRMFLMFGWLGSALAGAKEALAFDVPLCEDCYRRDNRLRWAAWGAFGLAFLFLCGLSMITALVFQPRGEAEQVAGGVTVAVGMLVGLPALVAMVVILIVRHAQRPVHVGRIDERSESARLAFLNPSYYEHFLQHNLERLVAWALRHRKPMPVSADEAAAVVSRGIDEQDPRSPESLRSYFLRGQLRLQNGRYREAVEDLDRVLAVTGFENPHFLEAQYFRGEAHMRLGNVANARTDLERYVQAASDRTRVREAKRWLKELGRG